MKRMYVTLAVMFLLILGAGTLLAQQFNRPIDDQTSQNLDRRFKMRQEMHRRMMEKLMRGVGPDQDMFQDMEGLLDEVMKDPFESRAAVQNFQVEWSSDKVGRRLSITPNTPEQQLDISVSQGLISIKGKTEHKSSHGVSVSNFSNSFNVPTDCDPGKVKIDHKDGKILVFFPYLTQPKQNLQPIPPSDGDVQI
jgi:HSP20 family molecular chaperone IbpA